MAAEIPDDELRSLLSSIGKKDESRSTADAFARTPMAYDFKRPQQRISKDQIRVLENIHEQFARLFSSSLAGSMRMVIDVDLAFNDQVTYSEFVLSLSHPCSAYSFVMDPPGGSAVLSFSPELLMVIIDRAFGGKGTSFTADPRPLTPIEIGVVNKLVSRVFRDLEAAWEIIAPVQVEEIALESNPDFIQIAAGGDPVLLIAFEANAAHASGLIHLCYPLTTLDPLLPRLNPEFRQKGRHPRGAKQQSSSRALSKVAVPVVARLAHGSLPLREMAALQEGDVIKLDTAKDEPAVVFLGDQPKFLAKPGLDGKHRAVKIIEIIDEEEEESFL